MKFVLSALLLFIPAISQAQIVRTTTTESVCMNCGGTQTQTVQTCTHTQCQRMRTKTRVMRSAPVMAPVVVQAPAVVSYEVQTCQTMHTTHHTMSQQGFNFVPGCAAEAAQVFRTCRANGGGPFGCLLDAAITYVSCPGVITRSRQRIRARRIAIRARRGW